MLDTILVAEVKFFNKMVLYILSINVVLAGKSTWVWFLDCCYFEPCLLFLLCGSEINFTQTNYK